MVFCRPQVKHYLNYCPIALPPETELQPNDKGSYTKAQFTSSSDEDCDPSQKTKLHAKRLVFSKPSTSSLESRPEMICFNESSTISVDPDDVFDPSIEANESRLPDGVGETSPDVEVRNQAEMDVDEKYSQNDIVSIKISDEDSVKKTQKKRRRKQNKRNISLPAEVDSDKELMKYWLKRYRLFSKFDQGIKLDRGELDLITETDVPAIDSKCRQTDWKQVNNTLEEIIPREQCSQTVL